MKWLKSFESNSQDEYQELSSEQIEGVQKQLKPEPFNLEEIKWLKTYFANKETKDIKFYQFDESDTTYGDPYSSKTSDSMLTNTSNVVAQISTPKSVVDIEKCIDDWFLLSYDKDSGYSFYKCDEFEGLKKCLMDIVDASL